MAKPKFPDPPPDSDTELPETEPEITDPSELPSGVIEHDSAMVPFVPKLAIVEEHDFRSPPPGWRGAYASCGGCGAFLGDAESCARCIGGQS